MSVAKLMQPFMKKISTDAILFIGIKKMKEIKEMKNQILQFKDDIVNDRC